MKALLEKKVKSENILEYNDYSGVETERTVSRVTIYYLLTVPVYRIEEVIKR